MTDKEFKKELEKRCIDENYLQSWYQTSISEEQPPVWTEEHLDELYKDFYLIPKK